MRTADLPDLSQRILDTVPSGIVVVDGEGNIAFANPALEQLLGHARGQLSGRALESVLRWQVQPSQLRRSRSLLDHLQRCDALQLSAALELQAVTSSGRELAVELRMSRLADGQLCGAVWEIDARKQRERELELRFRALERSNADLEQFASTASHDLREPLRMVVSYTQLLAERYRGQLDEKADKWIDYAATGATRMQRLIDDLLAYARLENPGRPTLPISVADALRDALSDMRVLIQDHGATVRCASDLPVVLVDAVQLTQLFSNLIHNAIKFRSEAAPLIEVSAEPAGAAMWKVSVRDNGIGIDPRYHERIFQMFQRLHERSKYDGSGIGLATARKIVERHGGSLGVSSAPGRGSTFFFTLPAAPSGPIDREAK
ncbi:MAG TPA: ATP-binding protein [Polyangiales bacterium]|nr:ATP-binding protein [Polyangiales bacterium]